MIQESKQRNALIAIQKTIIHARFMAYNKEEHSRLAAILDAAEYLPDLILQPEDNTEVFRGNLVSIARQFKCEYIVQAFDEPPRQ
jgi:hypothetical protein